MFTSGTVDCINDDNKIVQVLQIDWLIVVS